VKTRQSLLAALTVSAAALAGCSADQLDSAAPTAEAAAPASDASTPSETDPPAEPEAEAETPESSSESTRHWLAPPPAPVEAETDPEAWADHKYTEWLHGMNTTYRKMCGQLTDLSVYRACVPEDPHAYITDFSATEIGELVVTIGPGPWESGTYDTEVMPAELFVAGNVPAKIARFATDFDSVTAVTPNGDSYTEPYDPMLDGYFDHVALEDMASG
jgi:hypothetical protein